MKEYLPRIASYGPLSHLTLTIVRHSSTSSFSSSALLTLSITSSNVALLRLYRQSIPLYLPTPRLQDCSLSSASSPANSSFTPRLIRKHHTHRFRQMICCVRRCFCGFPTFVSNCNHRWLHFTTNFNIVLASRESRTSLSPVPARNTYMLSLIVRARSLGCFVSNNAPHLMCMLTALRFLDARVINLVRVVT